MVAVFSRYLLLLLGYVFIFPREISARRHWQFPQLNVNPTDGNIPAEDNERLSALWYEQAVTGLMATVATRLTKELSPTSVTSRQLEACTSRSDNSLQYARCLSPAIRQKRLMDQWRKHREYRKKMTADTRRRRARYSRSASNGLFPDPQYQQQQQQPEYYASQGQSVPIVNTQQQFPLNQVPSEVQEAFLREFVTTTEKPLLVEIADWLTGAVRYAKANIAPPPPRRFIPKTEQYRRNPVSKYEANIDEEGYSYKDELARDEIIEDSPVDGFVKRLFAPAIFGNATGPEGWSGKHFTRQGLLSNITNSLDSFLKNHGHSPSNPNGPIANEIVPKWQFEFLEDVHQLVMQATQQTQQIAQQQQAQLPPQQRQGSGKAAVKLLSPRILPLESDQQQYDAKLLSPDVLSFNDEGIASLPQLLGATVGEASKEAWLKFILEASGAKDVLGGDENLFNQIVKLGTQKGDGFQEDVGAFQKVYGQVFDKFEQAFQQLYKTFSSDQINRMEERGFAYMSRDQIEYIYHSENSPCANQSNCGVEFDLDGYSQMSDHERDEALLDFILEYADAQEVHHQESWTNRTKADPNNRRRSKRTLLLTPIKFSPLIRMSKAVSMPIILSPVLFSPIILSPSLLGPIILSPALFSPVILSPFVLGTLLLSPFVGNPIILSPLVLFPIILSPLVLNPLILAPYVLTPIILSPVVLTPTILDPNVLSPLILDPGVLSPIILSPHALSPIILSPQAVGALILSPYALSPIIASPVAVFAIVLSPSVLG